MSIEIENQKSEIELTDLQRLGAHLEGTAKSIMIACDEIGIEEDPDWDDKLLDINIERCVGCEWWHESCMLEYVESRGGGFCDQCLKDEGLADD
jgi:hypothetical protein